MRWLLALVLAMPLAAAADFEAGLAAALAGDYAQARREWQPLAEAGNRDAQFNMGLLYESGLGVAADGATAASWYRRAAEQDDREAQAYLAEMYAKGLGVERNDAYIVMPYYVRIFWWIQRFSPRLFAVLARASMKNVRNAANK